MDGDIGWFTIKPDQMQVVNPLLILIFIPLYEVAFYPLLNLIGVRRPLQKLTIGGTLAGVAFVISAIVEMNLEETYAVMPEFGSGQLRLYNGRNCAYRITTNLTDYPVINIPAQGYWEEKHISMNEERLSISYDFTSTSAGCTTDTNSGNFVMDEKMATSYFLTGNNALTLTRFEDSPEKSRRGWPMVTVLANLQSSSAQVRMLENDDGEKERYKELGSVREKVDIQASHYAVYVDNQRIATDIELKLGGVYSLIITQVATTNFLVNVVTVTDPNSMSMLWLIPQYVVITLGEVMFSVTGLEFSFTQAPESMKSVIQGCWMLTVAFGNLIVVIITGKFIYFNLA